MPLRNPVDQPGSWTSATLQNGWSNYGSGYAVASYRKNSEGMVFLRGLVANSNPVSSQSILTLPTGFRPGSNQAFVCMSGDFSGSAYALGRADVLSDGTVFYFTGGGSYFSLSNISFLAGG